MGHQPFTGQINVINRALYYKNDYPHRVPNPRSSPDVELNSIIVLTESVNLFRLHLVRVDQWLPSLSPIRDPLC